MATPSKTGVVGNEKAGSAEHVEYLDEKKFDLNTVERVDSDSNLSHDEDKHYTKPPTTARDLVTEVLLVEDDPTLNPWTFRTFFVGMGVSIFAAYEYLSR
jgi:hypothetical protein